MYEDKPKYDIWLKVLLGGVIALPFFLGLIQLSVNIKDALPVFGVALFEIILIRIILPRRFQILSDRLRIVLGGPFAINIPFYDIIDVRSRTGLKTFVYLGIRFATSANHTVEIVRKKGFNIVISPTDDVRFLERLNQVRNLVT
ncbi:PH domain-containing protein [Chloroflexota bacterium]